NKSVMERIDRIYSLRKKPMYFGSGVVQQILQLFPMRRMLVHPQFQETRQERSSPPPNLFDHVDADFPAEKSRQICEDFRDVVLGDTEMEDLWWRQSYAEKEKPGRFQREA